MPTLDFDGDGVASKFDLSSSSPAAAPARPPPPAPAPSRLIVELDGSDSDDDYEHPAPLPPSVPTGPAADRPSAKQLKKKRQAKKKKEAAAAAAAAAPVSLCDSDDEPPPVLEFDADAEGTFDLSSAPPPPPPKAKAKAKAKSAALNPKASKPKLAPEPAAGGGEEPTMMERVMADANKARAAKEAAKKKEQARMKSGFGGGLKGGFFSKKPKAAKPKKAGAGKAKANIETLRPNKSADPGLRLPEVQATMDASGGNTPAQAQAALEALRGGEWMTPDVAEKMAGNPAVLKAMSDPRFNKLVKEMQVDPKRAQEHLAADPELRDMFTTWAGAMGAHFETMGAAQQQQAQQAGSAAQTPAQQEEATKQMFEQSNVPDGPLTRDAIKQQQAGTVPQASPQEDADVQRILADPELRKLLMDPKTQVLLQECNNPAKLRENMSNPATSGTIRLLLKAGLVRIEGLNC